MTAGILAVPGIMPSRDRNGRAVVGTIRIYVDETTTPAPVYTSNTLATPISQPIVSDDSGRYPLLWRDNAVPVTLSWSTADGQTRTVSGLYPSTAASSALTDDANAALEAAEALLAGYSGAVRFNYSSTTSDADPGAGTLRLNSAAPSTATFAYIDNLDANGIDATVWLDSFDNANTGSSRGVLTLRNLADAAQFAVFLVTGAVVAASGYRKVPISFQTGSASFDGAASLAASFAPAGPAGAAVDGWSPVPAIISDGSRRVIQIIDWTGGGGTKPATGLYVGLTGLVALIANGVDVRGPIGISGAGTGDMLAANNLADVASAATSRSNLGLGTAAVLNTGTGANQVVKRDGSGNYPAGDGSAITGVVTANIDTLFYGDKSDGNVTISGATTLTRTMFYDTLTLAAGADLRVSGAPILCHHLDLSNAPTGAIKANGSAGGNASAATAGSAGSNPTAITVGIGGESLAGGPGIVGAGTAGAAGVAGGNGGSGGASGAGGTDGSFGGAGQASAAAVQAYIRAATTDLRPTAISAAFLKGGSSGSSGGSGGGRISDAYSGGGSGASGGGGGVVAIYAKRITRGASTAAGAIQAMGGVGGNGGTQAGGGGAGGGGGGGGWVYIVCNTLDGTTATNAVDVSSAQGGNGGNCTGGFGAGGAGAGAGQGGRLTIIQVVAGVVTDSFSGAGNTAVVAAAGATGGTGRAGTTARYDL